MRIARREALRAKGRTALIVAMIGLPVLALAFVATVYDMQRLTPQDRVTRLMGSADGIVYRAQRQSGPDGKPLPVVEFEIEAADPVMGGYADDTPHEAATILPYLPAGSSATGVWQTTVKMRTAHGFGKLPAYGIDAGNPITRGLTRLVSGRMPRTAGEVAVSPSALTRLGTRVGGTVATATGTRFTVVGLVEVSGQLSETLVFHPSAPIGDADGYWLVKQPGPMTWPQIQGLNRGGFVAQSRAMMLHPPKGLPGDSAPGAVGGLSEFSLGVVVAGLGLLEVVLLAGPAFAVGARRRQRQLALLGANGGTPAAMRRVVLADGVVSGVVAGVVGTGLGLALAYGLRGQLETRVFDQRFPGYRVDAWWLVGIAAIAVVTGLLGALVPAFTAGRQDIVLTLAGRRGTHRSRPRWVLFGVALVVLGGLAAIAGAYRQHPSVAVGGLCVAELGIVLCTPAIVGQVARLGRFLPLSPRIALRDISRRRTAASPAISAVMAAVAGSVVLTVYLAGDNHDPARFVLSAPAGTVVVPTSGTDNHGNREAPAGGAATKIDESLRDVFPGVTPVAVTTISCVGVQSLCSVYAELPLDRRCPYIPGPELSADQIRRARADPRCSNDGAGTGYFSDGGEVVTEDPTVVAALTGLRGAALDKAVSTLRGGGVLVSDPSYVEHGRALLSLGDLTATDDGQTPSLPGQVPGLPPGDVAISVPAYVVSSGAAQPILSPAVLSASTLGPSFARTIEASTRVRVGEVIARPTTAPTAARMDVLEARLGSITDGAIVEHIPVERQSPVPLILAISAGLVALGAAAIATGLAASESRAELMTMAAVGAAPRVRRLLSLAQAGTIAGLGALLGVVAGFGAAAAVLTGLNQQYLRQWPGPDLVPIHVPWTNFLVSLVVVPVVAMLGAGLLTRSRLPSERRAT
ncbi:FtsX-like permease family protein [Rugosimonospora acidiphila]